MNATVLHFPGAIKKPAAQPGRADQNLQAITNEARLFFLRSTIRNAANREGRRDLAKPLEAVALALMAEGASPAMALALVHRDHLPKQRQSTPTRPV